MEKKPELFNLVSNLNAKINKLQSIREIALFWCREVWTNHFTFFCFLTSQILLEGLKNCSNCFEAGILSSGMERNRSVVCACTKGSLKIFF